MVIFHAMLNNQRVHIKDDMSLKKQSPNSMISGHM